MSGLSFLVVLFCAMVIEFVRAGRLRRPVAAVPAAAVLVVLAGLPAFPDHRCGLDPCGGGAGQRPAGYFDQRTRNAVLNAQLAASAPLFGQKMDVLLWPEGGVDSDPTSNPATAAALSELSRRMDAPLLVSAVTERGADLFNSSLLWTASGHEGRRTTSGTPCRSASTFPTARSGSPSRPIDRAHRARIHARHGAAVGRPERGRRGPRDLLRRDLRRCRVGGADEGAEVYMFQTNNADFRAPTRTFSNSRSRRCARSRPAARWSTCRPSARVRSSPRTGRRSTLCRPTPPVTC